MTARHPHRNLLLALVLVAAAPLSAGCLEASAAAWDDARASVGAPPKEIAARSALDEASEEAAAWNASARLANVATIETEREEFFENASANMTSDPDVGNGKATAWFFEFITPAASLHFGVRPDGSIVDRAEKERDNAERYEALSPLDAWVVNSDRAVEMLAANETWQEVTANVTKAYQIEGLTFELQGPDGASDPEEPEGPSAQGEPANESEAPEGFPDPDAIWFVMLADEQFKGAIAILDATSGEIYMVMATPDWGADWGWDYDSDVECPDTEYGCAMPETSFEDTYSGDLNILEDVDAYEFPVSRPGEWVEVRLSKFDTSPVGGIDVAVYDPAGNEVEMENMMGMSPFMYGGAYAGVADVAGTYTVEFRLRAPAPYGSYSANLRVGAPSEDWYGAELAAEPAATAAPAAIPAAVADIIGGLLR